MTECTSVSKVFHNPRLLRCQIWQICDDWRDDAAYNRFCPALQLTGVGPAITWDGVRNHQSLVCTKRNIRQAKRHMQCCTNKHRCYCCVLAVASLVLAVWCIAFVEYFLAFIAYFWSLLVASLTHVRGAIATTRPLPLPFLALTASKTYTTALCYERCIGRKPGFMTQLTGKLNKT